MPEEALVRELAALVAELKEVAASLRATAASLAAADARKREGGGEAARSARDDSGRARRRGQEGVLA